MNQTAATNTSSPISTLSSKLITTQQILTWSMLVYLTFGNIGNLCNCFVFLQKSLRSNSCSWYLFVSSVANIIALTFAIPTNIYSMDQINPSSYSIIYCKLRIYIYHTFLMISRYLIVFACIDRACLSSRQVFIRNFSHLYTARIVSLTIIIIWFIGTIHIPILSTIRFGYCIMPGIYSLVFGIYVLVFAGLIPPVSMSIFSLITIRNLHSIRVRIHTSGRQTNRLMRQRDFHLTRMLTAQVIVYVCTTTLYPLNTIYAAITISVDKSIDRQIIETFIYFLTGTFLLFINATVSFYIYIATSKAFRTEFKSTCNKFWHKILFKQRSNSTLPNVTLRFLTRTITVQEGGFQISSATTMRPGLEK